MSKAVWRIAVLFLAFQQIPGAANAAACAPLPHATGDQMALNRFWGRSVRLCRLPNGSEDVFADPNGNRVMADQQWLDDIARRYGGWAATGILAHEWGHIVQGDVEGTAAELQADCLAGVFMRGIGQPRWTVEQFAASNFSAGDADWRVDGHGTPNQRVNAALRGYGRYAGDKNMAMLQKICPLSAQ